jgi:transposase
VDSPSSPSVPAPGADIVSSNQPRAVKPRRRFTEAQKRAILAEAERCKERGDVGALLRRHGLYSATLTKWRQAFGAASPRGPGRPSKIDPNERQINELQRRIEQLEVQNKRTQGLLELQKKALALVDAATAMGSAS